MPLTLNWEAIPSEQRAEFREIVRAYSDLESREIELQNKLRLGEASALNQMRQVQDDLRALYARFPKNAISSGLVPQGHVHLPNTSDAAGRSGGLVHYDMFVDTAYTGTDGASVPLATNGTAEVYKTLQAAITAADADNAVRTIRVNSSLTEALTIPSTLAHDLIIIGEGMERTILSSATDVITTTNYSGKLILKDLTLNPATSQASIANGGVGSQAFEAYNVQFGVSVTSRFNPRFSGAYFQGCKFVGNLLQDAVSDLTNTTFIGCDFSTTNADILGDMNTVFFIGCTMLGSNDVFNFGSGSSVSHISWIDCNTGFAATTFVRVKSTCSGWGDFNILNCRLGIPAADGNIFIEKLSTPTSGGLRVQGCSTEYSGVPRPYVKTTALVTDADISGNSWNRGPTGLSVEDNGGFSIIGLFADSVFGPNVPADFGVSMSAGSSPGNIYIGTGVVTGADAIDCTVSRQMRGSGSPDTVVTATEGTLYWDTAANLLYSNNNSATGWTAMGAGVALAETDLLAMIALGT